MGAEFFSLEPKSTGDAGDRKPGGMSARLRQIHRWTSILFILSVVANFAAMVRRPVPILITYSPLPPLLILTITGLYLFVRQVCATRRPEFLATKG